MSSHPGKRLGPYKVLSAIGAVGMGEGYKARDTGLDQIVAIKLLKIPERIKLDLGFRPRKERP